MKKSPPAGAGQIDFLAEFARTELGSRLPGILDAGDRTTEQLFGIARPYLAFLTAALFRQEAMRAGPRTLVVVAPSNQEARSLADETEFFLGESPVAFFPGYENIPYEYAHTDAEISHARLRVLARLLKGETLTVFTSPEAVLKRMPAPARLNGLSRTLKPGDALGPGELGRFLVAAGFERTERVEAPGFFCIKGALVDLWAGNHEFPARIDYFDDEIESIRRFDPETQKTREKLPALTLLPAGELALSRDEIETFITRLNGKEFSRSLERPAWARIDRHDESFFEGVFSEISHGGLTELFPLVTEGVRFLDCFARPPLTVFFPAPAVRERFAQLRREYETLYERAGSERICLPPGDLLLDDPVPGALLEVFESYQAGGPPPEEVAEDDDGPVDLSSPETAPPAFESFPLKPARLFRGRLREARRAIAEILEKGEIIIITSMYGAQLRRIAGMLKNEFNVEVIEDENISLGGLDLSRRDLVRIVNARPRNGLEIPASGFYLWTDADIFGRSYRRRSRFKKAGSVPLDSFIDLKEGDHVVHVQHGVGRFVRLERVKAAGHERDFLVVEYADQDKLYVPLDQISLVQRYIAPVDSPRLDSLGKASFKKIRERVEKRVEELAQDLLKIYATRMSQKGFAFPPDTDWQEEFEADFEFEETPDQISAIEAVKTDMESARPMDRLICGDVGYGKTEVALRACFKAVMAGRQVALIAPTTILALQHFKTFSERLRNYPVKVDWVSRFRTAGEIRQVKEKMKAGEVDIVIGTHALFARGIGIKNLGLLVIDEEQRFGVKHKETIKKIKHMVDVLTMSATPIPRTLHMSLVGIRDLSLIQTPPRDRLPIQTYVMEDSDEVIREAILREKRRDGQVFFLHNRVESIEQAAQRIMGLVPEARVTVLHGRMEEDEIEEVLLEFVDQRFDVLVTTTIIESGIDMPNVNTLIVDRADTFGLSQLYQIRGRVGRSFRQAYAYLLTPLDRVLTEQAQKRLNTIQEYQELGSGFKVAMRDLEIRGAGNILGKEQSGDIMDVGFELYVKLLDEAVQRLRGVPVEIDVRCGINLNYDFFLPTLYIPDTRQRIELYKRFEASGNLEEIDALVLEMNDRFGPAPGAAETFVDLERVRTLASLAGFESVFHDNTGRIHLKAGEYFRVPGDHFLKVLSRFGSLSLDPGSANKLFFRALVPDGELAELIEILTVLAEPVRAEQLRREAAAVAGGN